MTPLRASAMIYDVLAKHDPSFDVQGDSSLTYWLLIFGMRPEKADVQSGNRFIYAAQQGAAAAQTAARAKSCVTHFRHSDPVCGGELSHDHRFIRALRSAEPLAEQSLGCSKGTHSTPYPVRESMELYSSGA